MGVSPPKNVLSEAKNEGSGTSDRGSSRATVYVLKTLMLQRIDDDEKGATRTSRSGVPYQRLLPIGIAKPHDGAPTWTVAMTGDPSW